MRVKKKRNKINLTLSVRSLSLVRYTGGDILVGVETVEEKLVKSSERGVVSLQVTLLLKIAFSINSLCSMKSFFHCSITTTPPFFFFFYKGMQ